MKVLGLRWAFTGSVLGQLAIFVVSLPGFGIETRNPSDYATWAGPLFLALTILVVVLGISALVLLRSRFPLALRLGFGQAITAVITNLFDFSHLGGPPPPPGPLALGAISIGVAILTVAIVWLATREIPPPESKGSR